MPYQINGTDIDIEPASGRWMPRDTFGIDGNGHPLYSAVRQYRIEWSALTPAQHNQLQGFFEDVITTGTATVQLPEFGASTYTFKNYSGCVLREPNVDRYYAENLLDTSLLVTNIDT